MIKNNKLGFTLVELLVAVSIIITASTIVVAILTSSFRSVTKTSTSEAVRQNGNNAINQITKVIKFAEGFKGASNDNTTFVSCPVTKTTYSYIKVISLGESKTFSCAGDNLSLNSKPLIDTAKVGISPGTCKITCSQDSDLSSPVIGVGFDLFSKSASISPQPERKATIKFSTSIKMRNP